MPAHCNGLTRIDSTLDFCPLNCIWERKKKGRATSGKVKKPKHHRCKNSPENPKTLTVALERDHLAFISSQALQKSIQTGKHVSIARLVREALQVAFPYPKQFDMFGDARA